MKSTDATKLKYEFDVPILVSAIILLAFGILMIYSTTGVVAQNKFNDAFFYVKRQSVAAILGIIVSFFVFHLPISFLRRYSLFILPIIIAFLVLPLLPVIGGSAGGAKRWINLGVRFQPGEFVKLLFIIFFAGYLYRHAEKIKEFGYGVLRPGILIFCVVGLYLLHPDFGSFAVVALISFCMLLVSGVRVQHIFYCILAGVTLIVPLIIFSPYRLKRVVSFLSPFTDPSGKGYQLIQSLIAVGSGHLTGVGLGDSQQKLFFLPAAHTDFIYAVISEELGFIGSCIVLIPFIIILVRGFNIAKKYSSDSFYFALSIGVTLLITLPAFLNVGVVTGILPTKGMVLPFVGYGGTNLVMCLVSVGMLLKLSKEVRYFN